MKGNSTEYGFIAALEREVSGLVRGWSVTDLQMAEVPGRLYCSQRAALICAGTGVTRAYTAAKVLIEKCSPRVLISIGFAGSCESDLRPGSVVVPATVLNAATGKIFGCALGQGQVVTLDRVAGMALKREASARFGAVAVDMEAAGVAAAAAEYNVEFAAIKVISDGAEEDVGFLSSFVTAEGFETKRFIAHIAFRPKLWPRVAVLRRNSKLASMALESAVVECMRDWPTFSAKHSSAVTQVQMKESC